MGIRDAIARVQGTHLPGHKTYRPWMPRKGRGFKYWAAHLGPNEPSIRAHKKRLAKLEAKGADHGRG